MAQFKTKDGLERMQTALGQKGVSQQLEERGQQRRRQHHQPQQQQQLERKNQRESYFDHHHNVDTEDMEPRYFSVVPIILPEASDCSWAFLHVFLIDPLTEGGEERDNLFATCAVASLNMGVACHREAYSAPSYAQRTLHLERAKAMYARAEALLLDEEPELDPDESLFQIYMAIYTNLVDVDRELGNFEEAASWMQALDDCVSCVPPWEDGPVFRYFRRAMRLYNLDMLTAKAA